MEITDVIKYFAKFPARQGVLKNFLRSDGDADYNELKQSIIDLPDPTMPLITDFVVSNNENEVAERIRNIDNYFMFLEYGGIRYGSPDKMRIRNSSFSLAAHICYHNNGRNLDSMEEAIIMDNCLALAISLAKQMIIDDNLICPQQRYVESTLNLDPIEPALLYQSVGWAISFKKSNDIEL